MKKKIIVMQNGYRDCACACLLSIIRAYGQDMSRNELEFIIKTDNNGTNAYNMIEGMKKIGIEGYGLKLNTKDIFNDVLSFPFIAHVKINQMYHYVVVYSLNYKKRCLELMDPARGKCILSEKEFNDIYLGSALKFYPVKTLPKLDNKNSVFNTLKNIIFLFKRKIILVVLLSFILMIITLISSFYFKIFIDYLIIKNSIKLLLIVGLFFFIITLIKQVILYLRNILLITINKDMSIKIMKKVIKHVLCLPYPYFKNRPTGEMVSKMNDLDSLKDNLTKIFIIVFVDAFLILMSLIILYFINKTLLILVLLVALFYSLTVLMFSRILKSNIFCTLENEALYNTDLIETLSGYSSIKNLSLINKFIIKLFLSYKRYTLSENKLQKLNNVEDLIKNLIIELGSIVIIVIGSVFVFKQLISLGDLIVFYTLYSFFIDPIKEILELYPSFQYMKSTLERINDFLLVKEDRVSEEDNTFVSGDISIFNLSFSYNGSKNIIDNTSLSIKEKDKTLLYGPSGSGKSSICKILLGYYNEYEGGIKIGNMNIKDINPSVIRNSFAYVSQNEYLFTGSIKDNIILERNIEDDVYRKALSICNVDKIIDKKGLRDNSIIEDGAFNISGGEKQKIVLCRALLRDCPYIILDEALSEVEIEEEALILKKLEQGFKDKTIIYVSHKEEIRKYFSKSYVIS
ncbi:MAG: ATP-binding cassette domain-containing protein [Bacilli bacterium]